MAFHQYKDTENFWDPGGPGAIGYWYSNESYIVGSLGSILDLRFL